MRHLMSVVTLGMVVVFGTAQKIYIPDGIVRSNPTELERFMDHVAQRESDNTPTVVNRYGMMGKYQFSPSTVKSLGFNVSKQQFLYNSELQDTVMVHYMRVNHSILQDLINRYDGHIFKGVKITRSGVLAAAHLVGSNGVIEYFNSNDPDGRKDGNGTSVRDYLTEFNKYNLRATF
jgi:Transglycosylase SLT domain